MNSKKGSSCYVWADERHVHMKKKRIPSLGTEYLLPHNNKPCNATLIHTTHKPKYLYKLYFNVNSLPMQKVVCKKTWCQC